MSQTKRVSEWLATRDQPSTIELRLRGQVIDTLELPEQCTDFLSVAEELENAGKADARDAGRTRVYDVWAIDGNGERTECRIKLRCLVEKDQSGQIVQAFDMLMKYASEVTKENGRLRAGVEKVEARSSEMLDRLESLRSESLERDMKQEKHKALLETLERGTDIALPLLVAAIDQFTEGKFSQKMGGMLPAPDLKALALVQIAQAMSERQLDILPNVMGDRWEELREILEKALHGQADVEGFVTLTTSLPPETITALTMHMNPGQQAAVKVIFGDNQAQN